MGREEGYLGPKTSSCVWMKSRKGKIVSSKITSLETFTCPVDMSRHLKPL